MGDWQMPMVVACGVVGLLLALFAFYSIKVLKHLNPGEWQQWPLDHRENVSNYSEAVVYVRMMRIQTAIVAALSLGLMATALLLLLM